MSAQAATKLESRRALEALRNGVPNRDAVASMGCSQPHIQKRFEELLTSCASIVDQQGDNHGLLIAGDFGAGKSHLLEFLEHTALSKNFVCSRIVISKETPLYDLSKVFRAAIESAVVLGLNGQVMQEIAFRLDANSPRYAAFYEWAGGEISGLSTIFPATLLLRERLRGDPELEAEIVNFWSGERLPISRVKRALKQIGAGSAFVIKGVPARLLPAQQFRFAVGLVRAAEYSGWVLLIDEVELIGRYSIWNRGRAYAELARWMGQAEGAKYPGLVAVAAITQDYALARIDGQHDGKPDRDYIPPKFTSKGTEEAMQLAALAETGMRIIERDAVPLTLPDEMTLCQTLEKLKEIYKTAYGEIPSNVELGEQAMSRRMRSYVRRWINEWDLRRLYPDKQIQLEEQPVQPGYQQDPEGALEMSEDSSNPVEEEESQSEPMAR